MSSLRLATKIDSMSFAHLKQSDIQLLKTELRDASRREKTISLLVEYLLMWSPEKWVDEEKIFYLGADIGSIAPVSFRERIVSVIREKVSDPVADVFLKGFASAGKQDREAKAGKPLVTLPAPFAFEEVSARIETGDGPDVRDDVMAFAEKHMRFAEQGGDPGPMAVAFSDLGELLLAAPPERHPWAADTARQLAQHGIRWAENSERLWGLWGRSMVRCGAVEAAQLVYWESVRKFPWNPNFRIQLIGLLERSQGGHEAALKLARSSSDAFPSSAQLSAQLAILLARSSEPARRNESFEILTRRIEQFDDVSYSDLFALTESLATLSRSDALTDRRLRALVDRIRRRSPAVEKIKRYLLAHQRTQELAKRLWSDWTKLRPASLRTLTGLAKADAISEREAALAELEHFLRSTMRRFASTSSREALARVLSDGPTQGARLEDRELIAATIESAPAKVESVLRTAELLAVPRGIKRGVADLAQVWNVLREHSVSALEPKFLGPDGVRLPARGLVELIPTDVQIWGSARRLRFELDSYSTSDKEQALADLEQMHRTQPDDLYVTLLAVREGIASPASDAAHSFVISFEQAFRDEDVASLGSLADKFPRFNVLVIVGQALLGDRAAIARFSNLPSWNEEFHPASRVLVRRIQPHLDAMIDGRSATEILKMRRADFRAALHDSIEASLIRPRLSH